MVEPTRGEVALFLLIAALKDRDLPGGGVPVFLELEWGYLRTRMESGTELGGRSLDVHTIHRLLRIASSYVAHIPHESLWSQRVRIKALELLRLMGEVAEEHNYPWFKEERP